MSDATNIIQLTTLALFGVALPACLLAWVVINFALRRFRDWRAE